jgi:hypothetical protein
VGWWVPPSGPVANGQHEPIGLVAYDLSEFNGHRIYRRLAMFFPTKGENLDPASNGEVQYDLCVPQHRE